MKAESEPFIKSNSLFKKNLISYVDSGMETLLAEKYGYESDITKQITFSDSVIPAAICIAAYMGFKKIYIIGCDADYFFKKRNFHFYKEDLSAFKMPNKPGSLEKMAYKFSQTLKSWRLIEEYFSSQGVEIINAGIGGRLDMFPRVRYKDLFK